MTKDSPSLKKLPDTPGVYFFIGTNKEVLYVGKATSLKDRVRSYFSSDLSSTRGPQIVQMVDRARRVDFREADSVLEALILEANLIKELKPRYNTDGKDDKSYNYLVITTNETYPRLLTVRGKDLARRLDELNRGDGLEVVGTRRTNLLRSSTYNLTPITSNETSVTSTLPVYGPFVHAGQFKEALKIVRKIFPYYDTLRPVEYLKRVHDKKLQFNETIGVYPKMDVTEEEYRHTIKHIRLFFDGKKKQLLASLERDMRIAARKQEFEAAEQFKRQARALQHIRDVSLIRREPTSDAQHPHIRIEGYDIAHLGGDSMVGVMTVVENGEPNKSEYRTFIVRSVNTSNDTAALHEVLSRRLAHNEWTYPGLIVVDGGKAQQNAALRALTEYGLEIPLVSVVKDERHRPREILGQAKYRTKYGNEILLVNAESHRFALAVHMKKRAKKLRA